MTLPYINGIEEFEEKITRSKGIKVVEFGAAWCPPCRALEPVLSELAGTLMGKVEIYKVDIDKQPELSAKFAIRSLPTVLVFKYGTLREQLIGYQPRHAYLASFSDKAS